MKKKRVLLFTGNHRSDGIIDYIQSLKRISDEAGFILHIKNNIKHGSFNKYHSIIFIEQFFSLRVILETLKILNSFGGKKILILTEFFNKSHNTFNNFENLSLKKEEFCLKIYYKFINFLILTKTFAIFYNILITFLCVYKLFKNIFDILFLIFIHILNVIIGSILSLYSLFLFQGKLDLNLINRKYQIFITRLKIKRRTLQKKKFKNYLKQYNILPDQYFDYVLMKKRYLSLLLFINRFDLFFKSHDQIYFKNYKMSKFYFYLNNKNNQIKFNYKKKINLEFSGFLTSYRLKFLKNLCMNKNKFFNYSNIESLLVRTPNKFIEASNNLKNVCSIHLKKTKNWKYSSPSRYFNSLSNNKIPLILDDFNDTESNLLTVKTSFLKCKNVKEIKAKINELNSGIRKYKNTQIDNNIFVEQII